MKKYKEVEKALYENIREVFLTLGNKGLDYRQCLAFHGKIDVSLDNKKIFVLKICEVFSKDVKFDVDNHGKEVIHTRTKTKGLQKRNALEVANKDTGETDKISHAKRNDLHDGEYPLLKSLKQDGVTFNNKERINSQTSEEEDKYDSHVGIDDWPSKVKIEAVFSEALDKNQLLNVHSVEADVQSSEIKQRGSSKKRRSCLQKHENSFEKSAEVNKKDKSSSGSSDDTTFHCTKCLKQFQSEPLLTEHACNPRERTLVCDVCNAVYKSKAGLKTHKIASHLPDIGHPFRCVTCGAKFGCATRLQRHRQQKHSDCKLLEEDVSEGASESVLSFYCFICHMPFGNRHSLDKHEIANHLPDKGHPFKCTTCAAKFGCAAHLTRHEKSHSGKEAVSDYSCKQCGMKFEREASLKKHQSTHLPRKKLYCCMYCEQTFCTQYEMKLHIEGIHDNQTERKYTCSSCKEAFETFKEKKSHLCVERQNLLSYIFQCTVCECRYDSEMNLTSHQSSGENCLQLKNGTAYSELYCMECNIEFPNETVFSSHIHVRRPEQCSPLETCEYCGLVCEKEGVLTRHENTFHLHKENTLYHCPVCDETWDSKSTLLTHINTHRESTLILDGQITYRCSCCKAGFDSKESLSEHKSSHLNKKGDSFPCKSCHASFNSQEEVFCHVEVTHLETNMTYGCTLCSDTFSELKNLKAHEAKKHTAEELSSCACIICGSRFDTQTLLDEHLNDAECDICRTKFLAHCQLHHHVVGLAMVKRKQEVAYCVPCGKSFSTHVSLMLHERRQHQPEEGHPYKCNECGRRFGNQTHLRRHTMIHTNVKPFLCDHCGKSFRSERSRSIHDKLFHHDGEEYRFQCTHCHKKFGSQQNLDRHELVHTGFKPHLCVACGRRFKSKETLRDHDRRVHQGQFEFNCKTCGHGFKTEFKLQLHELLHQEYSEFKCQKCDEKFTSMANLTAHHNSKHSDFVAEKKLQCGMCGARYPDSNQLNHHQSSHLRTKMFKCEMCHATFQHKTSLFRHRNSRCPKRKEAENKLPKSRAPRIRTKSSAKKSTESQPPPQTQDQPPPGTPDQSEEQVSLTQLQSEEQVSLTQLQIVPTTVFPSTPDILSTAAAATTNIPIVFSRMQEPPAVLPAYTQMTFDMPPPLPQGQSMWEAPAPLQQQMHFGGVPMYRPPSHPHAYSMSQQFPLQLPGQPQMQPR